MPAHVVDRVCDDLDAQLADLDATLDDDLDSPPDAPATSRSDWDAYRLIQAALIPAKRQSVVGLRDAHIIDDIGCAGWSHGWTPRSYA